MSNDLPIWGCPWHGKIQGGRLELPDGTEAQHNGEPLQVRQPGGLVNFLSGKCTPVSMPGATGSDESEPDENGQHFRKTALLASDQVNGIELPAGSWIYHDSDGENWLITCNLHGFSPASPNSVLRSITARPFGRIAQPGQEPPAPVTRFFTAPQVVTNLNWSAISPRYFQVASSQTGSRVCFGLYVVQGPQGHVPRAFLELELSGPGNDLTITPRWAKTFEEAGGTPGGGSIPYRDYRYTTELTGWIEVTPPAEYPSCGGLWESKTNYVETDDVISLSLWVRSAIAPGSHVADFSFYDVAIGAFYNDAGQIDFIYMNAKRLVSAHCQVEEGFVEGVRTRTTQPGVSACEFVETGSTPASMTFDLTESMTIQSGIEVKAGEAGEYQALHSRTDSYSFNMQVEAGPTNSIESETSWQSSEGPPGSYAAGSTNNFVSFDIDLFGAIFNANYARPARDQVRDYGYRGFRYYGGPSFQIEGHVVPLVHSPSLVGLGRFVGLTHPDPFQLTGQAATPGGVIDISPISGSKPAFNTVIALQGAWNPITGDAVRAFESVNFM